MSLRFVTLYPTATQISFKILLLWLIKQWSSIWFFFHLRCRAVQRDKSQTHHNPQDERQYAHTIYGKVLLHPTGVSSTCRMWWKIILRSIKFSLWDKYKKRPFASNFHEVLRLNRRFQFWAVTNTKNELWPNVPNKEDAYSNGQYFIPHEKVPQPFR